MPKVLPARPRAAMAGMDIDRTRFRAAPPRGRLQPRPQPQLQPQPRPQFQPQPIRPAMPSRPPLMVAQPAKRSRSSSMRDLVNAIVEAEVYKPPVQPISQAPTQVASQAAPRPKLPPIDMELPGSESPLRQIDSLLRYGKLAVIRRWMLRGAVAAVILVMVVGGFLFSQGWFNLHKSFKGNAAALKTNVNPNLLKGEGDGRINVLLLGRGGGNHEAPDLTDTMMLDSIDPVNHTSTLISIPRDLWVDVPNQGAMKINSAFEAGEFKYLGNTTPGSTNPNAIQAGFDEADQTIESVLGVTIHYNVLVSFQAFQQAVDTVNGVTVNVPSDLVDPTMAWENGNDPLLAKAGTDTFNGKQALNYVRSRETTSDFARGQRQRTVLLALKGKVVTAGTLSNPLKISRLVKAFGDNVHTDLSLKDATRLYGIIKAIPDNKTNSIGLADPPNNYITTGTLAGQSIALPGAGLFNYNAIQAFLRTQLKDPYILKENARISILNGTQVAGLAATKAAELKTYGYNVVQAGNAPNNNYLATTIVDLTHGKDKYTKHYLEQRLGVTATSQPPDKTIQTNGADFVIILGSDEAIPTQN